MEGRHIQCIFSKEDCKGQLMLLVAPSVFFGSCILDCLQTSKAHKLPFFVGIFFKFKGMEKYQFVGHDEKNIINNRTGKFVDDIDNYIVFDSEIEIQGNTYGIFDNDFISGICDINTGEIIGSTHDYFGKIVKVNGKYLSNIRDGEIWKIIDVITGEFLYGLYDYVYDIDQSGFAKVNKNGIWSVLDLKDGNSNMAKFDLFFNPILINNKKYIKVIDGYVDISTGLYVGGKFHRVKSIHKVGDKYYFLALKDLSKEDCVCGLISFDTGKIIGDWYDYLEYNFDEYTGDSNDLDLISYLIDGIYCIKITHKEKQGILSLESGKIISHMFDTIEDVKIFNGKNYLIFTNNSRMGIYSIEKQKIILSNFTSVIDYIDKGSNIYLKIEDMGDIGYIDLFNEKLLGDTYEKISEIKEINGNFYFSFSYFDGTYGLYDISNDFILNSVNFYDLNHNKNSQKARGLNIKTGFDAIGSVEIINGKIYFPVKIGSLEGIYCYTDKIIIGDLYDQLGFEKEVYNSGKYCDIRNFSTTYYFVAKKGWRYGYVYLDTGEFKPIGLLENIFLMF